MKKLIVTSIIALLLLGGETAIARNRPDEYLGLPGDNLNLYAVMKLFQSLRTLEDFERSLNDQNSRINNLDLNGDNLIDYISVIDYPDGNNHNIVLQVALNRTEKQDVAVFTVQRFYNGSVQIQLIGDAALYGKNYIIEPIYADNSVETPNPGYVGTAGYADNTTVVTYTAFDIAAWPLISYIYMPGYITWHSSWYWGYWPEYWHPWRPYYWDYYYGYHYNCFPDYYRNYHHCDYNRYHGYDDFYYSNKRSYSHEVNRRIVDGGYKTTYSHPEQRREGAELYARTNQGQNNRRADNAAISSQGKRSFSTVASERRSAGNNSNSTYKSAKQTTDRRATVSRKSNNPGTVSRSTAPGTTNSRGTVSRQNSSPNTFSKSSGNRTERSITNANTFKKSNANREMTASSANRPTRSTPSTFSQRAASRPGPAVSHQSARSSGKSPQSFSSTVQRSSRASSPGTSVSSKSSSREPKADKSTSRR
jgi:hypothetical protein